jgi:hypothetical protein
VTVPPLLLGEGLAGPHSATSSSSAQFPYDLRRQDSAESITSGFPIGPAPPGGQGGWRLARSHTGGVGGAESAESDLTGIDEVEEEASVTPAGAAEAEAPQQVVQAPTPAPAEAGQIRPLPAPAAVLEQAPSVASTASPRTPSRGGPRPPSGAVRTPRQSVTGAGGGQHSFLYGDDDEELDDDELYYFDEEQDAASSAAATAAALAHPSPPSPSPGADTERRAFDRDAENLATLQAIAQVYMARAGHGPHHPHPAAPGLLHAAPVGAGAGAGAGAEGVVALIPASSDQHQRQQQQQPVPILSARSSASPPHVASPGAESTLPTSSRRGSIPEVVSTSPSDLSHSGSGPGSAEAGLSPLASPFPPGSMGMTSTSRPSSSATPSRIPGPRSQPLAVRPRQAGSPGSRPPSSGGDPLAESAGTMAPAPTPPRVDASEQHPQQQHLTVRSPRTASSPDAVNGAASSLALGMRSPTSLDRVRRTYVDPATPVAGSRRGSYADQFAAPASPHASSSASSSSSSLAQRRPSSRFGQERHITAALHPASPGGVGDHIGAPIASPGTPSRPGSRARPFPATPSAASGSSALPPVRSAGGGGVYTRANVEALRARIRRALGPAVFDRVLPFMRQSRGMDAGVGGGATGAVQSTSASTSHLRNRAFAGQLLTLLDGNRALLPVCAEVEQLLYMEAVVAMNEAKGGVTAPGAGASAAATDAGSGGGGEAQEPAAGVVPE